MSRIIGLLAALGLAACTSPPADQHLDVVFDVCAPITVVAPTADAAQLAAIDAALASWAARGVAMLVRAGDVPPAGAIEIRFEDAAPAFHGLYDDEAGVVYVNTGLDAEAGAVAIAHELGHAFGLWHVDAEERTSVMNPGNLSVGPTSGDADALTAVWGACGR